MENDWAGLRGTGRSNLSRATKFSCAKGRPGKIGFDLPCSTDHEQDWQPYPVDAQCATSDGRAGARFWKLESRCVESFPVYLVLLSSCLALCPHPKGDGFWMDLFSSASLCTVYYSTVQCACF